MRLGGPPPLGRHSATGTATRAGAEELLGWRSDLEVQRQLAAAIGVGAWLPDAAHKDNASAHTRDAVSMPRIGPEGGELVASTRSKIRVVRAARRTCPRRRRFDYAAADPERRGEYDLLQTKMPPFVFVALAAVTHGPCVVQVQ